VSLAEFQYLRPRTVEEAVGFLVHHAGNLEILAGGTDLIPSMRQRLFTPGYVMDIRSIAELRGIHADRDWTVIGALTSLTAIERNPELRRDYPVLTEAAATVASPILRNMGTIGGNICLDTRCLWYNQSLTWRQSCGFCIKKDGDLCHVAPGGTKCWAAFSADTPPALLCLGAGIEIAGPNGIRRVLLKHFYTDEGDARMKLEKNELVTRVYLPRSAAGYHGAYRKLRVRGSIDYPLAGVAVAFRSSNGHLEDASVAITAVNPAPHLVPEAHKLLASHALDEATAAAAGDLAAIIARPLTTSALSPEYRREMIRILTKRALLDIGKSKPPR
jgi:4-hydroxybenzoyl-CoA reductase subunit beta